MAKMRYLQAINAALREEMERDSKVFVMGLDVVHALMGATEGLAEKFGKERVVDTPLSELSFTGLGVGAAMAGLRPVIEYQVNSLQYLAMEQLVNQAAKLRYMTGGQVNIPLTVRVMGSGGRGTMGSQHSDAAYAQLIHMGMKVVVPSTPYDAKGLIKQAIREDDPVVIYEPSLLYGVRGELPDEEYTIPIGVADVKREGTDITIVAVGNLVQESLQAAEQLSAGGISVEVVDPRTLYPLDTKTILKSVRKTRRLLVADDGHRFCSFASEIAAIVIEDAFDALQAPIKRVTRPQVPVPFNHAMARAVMPKKEEIKLAVEQVINKGKVNQV